MANVHIVSLDGVAACVLGGWITYWVFGAWLVHRTGDPASLRHAARAARAFWPTGRGQRHKK